MKTYCINCGNICQFNQRHCNKCLSIINPDAEDFEPNIIDCPHCGRGVSPIQPYCVFCKGELEKVYIIKR